LISAFRLPQKPSAKLEVDSPRQKDHDDYADDDDEHGRVHLEAITQDARAGLVVYSTTTRRVVVSKDTSVPLLRSIIEAQAKVKSHGATCSGRQE